MRHASLWTVPLIAICALPLAANTVTVDVNGTGDFVAIAPAVAAASSGDTVLVRPGLYEGPDNSLIDFDSKDIVLKSTEGLESTTINGYFYQSVLLLRYGLTSATVIEGLTFKSCGGLALLISGSSPIILGCRFTQNFVEDLEPSLDPSTAVGYAVNSSPLFEDCTFDDNTSIGSISVMNFLDSDATFRDCSFVGNVEWDYGYGGRSGVLHFLGASGIVLEDCTFEDNRSVGPCVHTRHHASVQVIGCRFTGNRATSGYIGEGVLGLVGSGSAEIRECTMSGNSTPASCVTVSGDAAVDIEGCSFVGNDSAQSVIGVDANTGGIVSLSNSVLAFNTDCLTPITCGATLPTMSACCFYETGDPDSMCEPYDPATLFLEDPLFCDFYSNDYTLCANSPCLPENNDWGVQIGAYGQGCDACGTPVEHTSWGSIKAMFR